ncbi:hypothetical protein [Candidatus Spongiisocius sp.]|uniref:hypothetical protein n=1 Tax=Candidatus Spongiisocius sp. TaxID=3101273 RepID=UPI003B5A0332
MVGVMNVAVNLLMALGMAGGAGLWIDRTGRRSRTRRIIAVVVGVALGALTWWGITSVDKLETTAAGVVVSILASGLIFIAANKLFDLAPERWAVFTTLVGAAVSFTGFAMLWGNRVIDDPVLRTVAATALGAVAGYLLGTVERPLERLAIGAAAGAALGALAASGMRAVILVFELERGTFELWPVLPGLRYDLLAILTLVGAGAGLVVWLLRGRRASALRSGSWGRPSASRWGPGWCPTSAWERRWTHTWPPSASAWGSARWRDSNPFPTITPGAGSRGLPGPTSSWCRHWGSSHRP